MDELRAMARELGLGHQVRFLGQVRNVRAVMEGAAIFILPSLTEGVSLTLLEAMASGLPVVATRVGGTPEVVVEGETGLLVPPSSPDELAQAILNLLQDSELRRQMGEKARQRIKQHFDIRQMIAKYENLYTGFYTEK